MAAGLIPSLHGLGSPMASRHMECRAIWKLWPLTQGRPIRSSSWGLLRSNEINGEPLEIEAPIKNDGCLPVVISGLLEVQNRPMQILARMRWFWQRERERERESFSFLFFWFWFGSFRATYVGMLGHFAPWSLLLKSPGKEPCRLK